MIECRMKWLPGSVAILAAAGLASVKIARAEDIRIGIIGCDTSHVTAFTDTLNNPEARGHVPGGKVVAAYKGGSGDIPDSANRVEGYAKTLQEKYGVRIYDRIEDLCQNVDAILLESLDGRPHLAQFQAIVDAQRTARAEKGGELLVRAKPNRPPVFIDKPMAGSLRDVVKIFKIAKQAGIPVFSSSALRFGKDTQAVRRGSLGKLSYVETYGPCELEPHHPDLFWYGVHGTEALFAVLGPGCESVKRTTTPASAIEVTGTWSDNRTGVFREEKAFRGMARGEKGEAPVGSFDGYVPLVGEIMKFYQTRQPPVEPEETIEIFAFMEAADESKARAGAPVKLEEIKKRAGL